MENETSAKENLIINAYFKHVTSDPKKGFRVAADDVVSFIPSDQSGRPALLCNLSKEQRDTSSRVSFAVWKRIFQDEATSRRIADPPIIGCGPPGSGKSTIYGNPPPGMAVFECTLSHDYQSELQRILPPLLAGKGAILSYMNRPPDESIPATMARAMHPDPRKRHRAVGKGEHHQLPTNALKNIQQLHEDGAFPFSGEPGPDSPFRGIKGAKLSLQAYDNSRKMEHIEKELANIKKYEQSEAFDFLMKDVKSIYADQSQFLASAEQIIKKWTNEHNIKQSFCDQFLDDSHPKPRRSAEEEIRPLVSPTSQTSSSSQRVNNHYLSPSVR